MSSLPSTTTTTTTQNILSWLPKENHFRIEEAIGRTVISIATHPFDYVKILIQIGYEPIPARAVTTIFGRKRMQYPGVISYLGHVRSKDGILGCYRGIGYKLAYTLIHGFAYANLTEWTKVSTITKPKQSLNESATDEDGDQTDKDEEDVIDPRGIFHPEKLKELLDTLMRETACKFLALSIAYPFHVMTVRCCSQFIGGERIYNSIKGSVSDIYSNSGIKGFWIGFMPKFVGDCIILWITHSMIYVTKGLLSNKNKESKSAAVSYISASINFVITSACYPFQLVSTVMICNGSPAASLESSAALLISGRDQPYHDWIDCWKHLSSNGDLKRGSSMFWRYQPLQKKNNYVGRHYGI